MSRNEKLERQLGSFLDEKDSRIAVLYRKLPKPEPDAKLDAAVMAMAHRAIPASARPQRPRWLPAISAAAVVALAAGVAFRLGPQVWRERSTAAPATIRDGGTMPVRPADTLSSSPIPPPPPAKPALAAPAPTTSMQTVPVPKPLPMPVPARAAAIEAPRQPPAAAKMSVDRAKAAPKELHKVENAAAQPAAPMAFPTPAPSTSAMDSETANMPAQSGKFSEPVASLEAAIQRIRRELREDHRDAALRDLAEFRRRYPDYILPPDLHDLK